ncbi:50S ribosomal protein L4 [Mycoplasmopsis felis]|nr:50S ribosomal protein L4 [Mycoplasmopsis felis]MCU9933821.1 50S ribosomal protein L4 [Mycoplasmopsis felis]
MGETKVKKTTTAAKTTKAATTKTTATKKTPAKTTAATTKTTTTKKEQPKSVKVTVKKEKVQKEVFKADLPKKLFASEKIYEQAIFDSILSERASRRQGTHQVKNRAEVSGSGKKP